MAWQEKDLRDKNKDNRYKDKYSDHRGSDRRDRERDDRRDDRGSYRDTRDRSDRDRRDRDRSDRDRNERSDRDREREKEREKERLEKDKEKELQREKDREKELQRQQEISFLIAEGNKRKRALSFATPKAEGGPLLKRRKETKPIQSALFSGEENEVKKIGFLDFSNGDTNMGEGSSSSTEETPMEEDPLEAYMASITSEAEKLKTKAVRKAKKEALKRGTVDVDLPEEDPVEKQEKEEEVYVRGSFAPSHEVRKKKPIGKILEAVDHKTVQYIPFRRDFYIEVPEISKMTAEQIHQARKDLDGIKIRGKGCPTPVKTFAQCGLPSKIISVLQKYDFQKPTPIQAQAIPAVMGGRDVIGIAKTGSGKTLAFLLPMYRHILDQPPLGPFDGPIALIMVPTRELAVQIHSDCKRFKAATGIRSVCVYGGAGVKHQIGDLKRGAQIVVCTPGRMIDILCANKGRVTNLQRVSFLVLDEADRMFDMGFEPQITKIISNIQPDRQTVLFSATFPRTVEAAARKILKNPVEITVRGQGVVADTIDQKACVITDDAKFQKLLELVSEWYDVGSILVFVDRQEATDQIWKDLIKSGYTSCGSLHGAKDQLDRESTLKDFKAGVSKILVATSIAARGLDVPSIRLVVNYDMPNHLEDYVHRVGRTGRAGNRGTSWTFITPGEEEYSRDLVKAMKSTNQEIPPDVQALFDAFESRRKTGEAKKRKSGFTTGTGWKFDENEAKEQEAKRKMEKMAYGVPVEEEEKAPKEEDAEGEGDGEATTEGGAATAGDADAKNKNPKASTAAARDFVRDLVDSIATQVHTSMRCAEEIEINDYPQQARWKVTHKDALASITEFTGCGVTAKGQFYPPGRNPPAGLRKLFLFIEGNSYEEVKNAKLEIKRILDEAVVAQAGRPDQGAQYGKYSI